MMLQNHIAVSAPCHMIAVMKDDGLISSSSQYNTVENDSAWLADLCEDLWQNHHVGSGDTLLSRKAGESVFNKHQLPHRFVLIAFQQCRTIASPLVFRLSSCLSPAWSHTQLLQSVVHTHSTSHETKPINMMFCHVHKCCNLIGAALFPVTTCKSFHHECYHAGPLPLIKGGRGLGTRLWYDP